MASQCILIGSKNKVIVPIIKEVADELAINIGAKHNIEDFLLDILENDYKAIILDINISHYEPIKTIRLIRRMRPKIPLITLGEKIEKEFGGKILSEGVFQLIMSPPSRENLRAALKAISNLRN